MTDDEIIELIKVNIHLTEYVDNSYTDVPVELLKSALDLINRQKAEIEKLNSEIEEANRIEKENELEALEENKENAKTFLQAIQHAKSEAIKEFAERLKPSNSERYISYAKVKRLVKEMAEV